MKWIGQHIWDFVSRFRSDVYLDSPTAGGSDPDKFLGIDSNNKIIYRTGTQVLSDIGGSSSTGDIDRVSLTTDDSNFARASSGNADLTLAGGACIDTTADGNVTATIAVDLSELSTSTDTGHIESGFFAVVDGENGQHKMAASTIPISSFNNDSGFASGDITGVTAGTNLSGGGASGSVTINLADASTSAKGAASFSSDNFAVSSVAVTIKSGGVDLTDEVTGVLPVANTAAKVTSIVAGDGIDVSGATGDVTVTAETATDSNPGVVELATTGEADTGTDTARAVTPAGLESHVSARYSYQYINFIGNSDETTWSTPAQTGSNANNWNNDTGETGTTVGGGSPTTITLGRQYSVVGFTAPYTCELMGFYGTMRNHNNDNQGHLGLFVASGSDIWGATGTKTYTLRAMGSADKTGGSSYTGGCKVNGILGSSYTLTQGDIIVPAVLETTTDKVFFQMTMVVKTLIPT